MLGGDISNRHMQRERGCAVVRQGHLIAVVGTFLIGCAVLLIVVGCSGVRSKAPKEEKQENAPEATK
jgi:large-conductance mechanosensitive channel